MGLKDAIARDTPRSAFAVLDPNAMSSRVYVVVERLRTIARDTTGLAKSFIARADLAVLFAFKLSLLVGKNRSFLCRKSVDLFLYWGRRRQTRDRVSLLRRRWWERKSR